jgi:hypothetical protein
MQSKRIHPNTPLAGTLAEYDVLKTNCGDIPATVPSKEYLGTT